MEGKSPTLVRATVRGTAWSYVSFYSGKLMVFISTIILARLLSKDDFGVAGYALVVIAFLDVFSDLGIGAALIYQHDDPESTNTAFWLGMFVSSMLCVLTFAAAPLAGRFFNDARAVDVTRVLALNFPLAALGNIHDMLLRKKLSFSKKFVPDFAKSMSKGVVSIALALLGFGTWSLIVGHLTSTVVSVIAYWKVMPWRPTFHFSFSHARELLSYGLHIVAVNGLGIVLSDSDYLLVGRFLGAAALGVYSVAFRIPDLLIMQFCSIISKVVFPVFSRMRDDARALAHGFAVTTRYVSLVTVPLGLGMALVARPLVLVAFTDKWIEAVPVIEAIAVYSLFLSLSYNAGDVYKAQGRPNILTYLSLMRVVVLVPGLFWATTVARSVPAVGWVHATVAFAAGLVELTVACLLLKMSIKDLTAALAPAFGSGALMAAVVWALMRMLPTANPWLQLIAAVAVGGLVYGGSLWLLQRDLVLSAGKTLHAALVR